MICEHCGIFFCCQYLNDGAALSGERQKHCSPTCKQAARRARRAARGFPLPPPPPRERPQEKEKVPPVCPTGNDRYQKKADAVKAAGVRVAQFQAARVRAVYDVYHCADCQGWHFTAGPVAVPRLPWRKTWHRKAPGKMMVERKGPGTATCPDCGKQRFLTRKDALQVGRRFQGKTRRAYRCGDFWHVTTVDAAAAERFRARDAR